jgi:hypothetical protein
VVRSAGLLKWRSQWAAVSGYDPDLIVCLDRPELSPDGVRRMVPVRYGLSTSAKASCFFCSGGAACVHCSAAADAAPVRRRALSSETGVPGGGNAGRR